MKKLLVITIIAAFAAPAIATDFDGGAIDGIQPPITLYPGDIIDESSVLAGDFWTDSDIWYIIAYGSGELNISFSCEEGTLNACVGGGLIAYGGGIVSYGMTLYTMGMAIPLPLHTSVVGWGLYIMPAFYLWADSFPATYYLEGSFTP